jgi:hypothetical protein
MMSESIPGKDRPGVRRTIDDHWPQYFVMNCISIMNMVPDEIDIRFKTFYRLTQLAEDLLGWNAERFLEEYDTCQYSLREYNSKITWWMDRKEFHFDYSVSPKHN